MLYAYIYIADHVGRFYYLFINTSRTCVGRVLVGSDGQYYLNI